MTANPQIFARGVCDPQHLTPGLALDCYREGLVPLGITREDTAWCRYEPRAILPLDEVHVPRRLQRTLKQERFEIRIDTAFDEVIDGCAFPAVNRETTWIIEPIRRLACELHQAGYAHSVESWRDGKLVGGLYGVAVDGTFHGESMFTREDSASKSALVHLVAILRAAGYMLLDVQQKTNHIARFGAAAISHQEFVDRQKDASVLAPDFSAAARNYHHELPRLFGDIGTSS